MKFYQLAFCCLRRKKGKTLLLFLIFTLVGGMILGTSAILKTARETENSLREKAGAKILIEADTEEGLSAEEIETAALLDGVARVNRSAHHTAFPVDFPLLTKSESQEEENRRLTVFCYDDFENDSPFSEQRYRLVAGDYPAADTKGGAVVNFLPAQANGWEIGDEIGLQTEDGVSITVGIRGFFVSGSERKQGDDTPAADRLENLVFIDAGAYRRLFPGGGYDKAAVYAKDPEKLAALEVDLRKIFSDEAAMTTADALFRQMKAPLTQVVRVVGWMRALAFLAGASVVTILLCLWMRARKREIAVLIGIGSGRGRILCQAFLEAGIVFLSSLPGACLAGSLVTKVLKNIRSDVWAENGVWGAALEAADLLRFLGIGGVLAMMAVLISLLPVLRARPGDILSRTEG